MLTVVDKEGNERSMDDLANEQFACLYCEREIDSDAEFCHLGCEEKYRLKNGK